MTATTRRPQQERSRSTRRALVDAAVVCIGELGWTGATVAVIAERAGVSRGAAQHHFPTREDLVVATVEYLGEEQVRQLREGTAALPPGPPRVEAVVEMLLELYTGAAFRAALHLWVAASTDETLRDVVVPLQAKVGREAHRMAVQVLGADQSHPGVRELVQATMDLARGLGLANLLADDAARRTQIVAQWARVLGDALRPPADLAEHPPARL
jgi:AcrR family transcriptional regulator